MKMLRYCCANCDADLDVEMPDKFNDTPVEELLDSMLAVEFRQQVLPRVRVTAWIRHPCTVGVHGIAPLVAIVES